MLLQIPDKEMLSPATLRFASVLSHSDNKRVSGFVPSALHPNAFAKFITMQTISAMMSEGISDTRRTLGDISLGGLNIVRY